MYENDAKVRAYHDAQYMFEQGVASGEISYKDNLRRRQFAFFEIKSKLVPFIEWYRTHYCKDIEKTVALITDPNTFVGYNDYILHLCRDNLAKKEENLLQVACSRIALGVRVLASLLTEEIKIKICSEKVHDFY